MSPANILLAAIAVGFALFAAFDAYQSWRTYRNFKREYDNAGPRPPQHINCRCTLGDHE